MLLRLNFTLGFGMKANDFRRLMDRDGGCYHCGEREAVAPNHRANRGMGGSKLLDVPSNLVVLCSRLNGLIESDERYAVQAKSYGWKVSKWDDPASVPVYDFQTREWYLLNDAWHRMVIGQEKEI